MKNKKLSKKTNQFNKSQLSNKNILTKDNLLYGMTPYEYKEGIKIHLKCFGQMMKIIYNDYEEHLNN